MSTRELVNSLRPLVERMHRGHCWIKTEEGPRRLGVAFTDFMLAEHCAGRKAYGLCPVSPGESTTRVACLDFDSHGGDTDFKTMIKIAEEVKDAAELYGLEGVAFRSSGGRGVHLIFIWDTPQDAGRVRKLLKRVVNYCGLEPGTKGVAAGQVEVYPKQDSVPVDGFGSMFILPLAGESVLLK